MPSFRGIEIWSDVACNGGARVASLDRSVLSAATIKQSLSGVESLDFSLSRVASAAAQVLHARVARVCWSDTALDTEWRLADDTQQSGLGDTGVMRWVGSALLLDLARAPYVAWDAAGDPSFTFSATQLTASEWITTYVIPAIDESDLLPVSVGTIDYTTEFDLDGEYQSALEILRAILQPGRAPGELALRRNGATDYKIDILAMRGSSAATVRVQRTKNLLANVRRRLLVNVGTKIIPRAGSDAVVRHMGRAYWRVASVPSGTTATLEDPLGGDDPIAFDDQVNGLYVARFASTFSSQVVSDSVASSQTITVASTAGWAVGDFVEFRSTSGSTGRRLASLQHPTRALAPSAGGYGERTLITDLSTVADAQANIVPNAWTRTWSNHANPPDGWTNRADAGTTYSYESTTTKYAGQAYKWFSVGAGSPAIIAGPPTFPYTTAGLLYSFHAWINANAATECRLKLLSPDLLTTYVTGPSNAVAGGNWERLAVEAQDLSGLGITAAGVVVAVCATDGTSAVIVGALSMNEGDLTIGSADLVDIEGPAGNVLWQETNKRLAALSSPIAGYSTQLADLARLDNSAWDAEPLTLGGYLEVIDPDLSDTTTQRVVEYSQDLVNPLASTAQLVNPDPLITNALVAA